MMTFIAVLHLLVALLLIGLVLIQDSKGGGALGMGGGSNSVLGAAGAESLWAKLTRIIAAIFAITCISLTYMTASQTKSIIDSTPVAPAAAPTTSTPEAAPTQTPASPAGDTNAAPQAPDTPKK